MLRFLHSTFPSLLLGRGGAGGVLGAASCHRSSQHSRVLLKGRGRIPPGTAVAPT